MKDMQLSNSRATVLNLIAEAPQSGGYLLRTKIRAAIEFLNQLYQYGKAGKTTVNELGKEVFTEDVSSLEEFCDL